jgi:hypothetical protein
MKTLRHYINPIIAGITLTLSLNAYALDLSSISNQDANKGLKETLQRGAEFAVQSLGKQDGFLGNDKVRIPLPESLEKAKGILKMTGMGKQVEELEVSMNRAAEAAVPEAKTLLTNAIKNITVQDAKNILSGGEDSVTQFFKEKTQTGLQAKFLPIVKQSTEKVGLAKQYNNFAGQAAKLGVIKNDDANIENYVTRKALDGLYLIIAEQEKAIRANPLEAGSQLLQKMFSK